MFKSTRLNRRTVLAVLKRKIRGWLFPEYEQNRRQIERYGMAIQRLDELDIDALVAAEEVVTEFSETVDSANETATHADCTADQTTLVEGQVVLFLGDYRRCQFEAGEIGDVSVYGENQVIANDLFRSATPKQDSEDPAV